MTPQLSAPHQKTYQRVFEHPMAYDLLWRDVWAMLSGMADAQAFDDEKGNLKVSRNGRTLVLRRARGKELADKRELLQVRHFLERSEAPAATRAGHR